MTDALAGCLGENTLCALGRGELSPAERERAAGHVDVCEDCRELLALLGRDLPSTGEGRVAAGRGAGRPGPSRRLPAGTRVGRYTVLEEVGSGSMGVVYAAYDPELDRRVALKLVHDELWPDERREEAASRLLREARALARLSHPGVVTVFDAGRFEGQSFLAMEFVAGGTLGAWLRAAPRPHGPVLAAFVAAGRGLAAAHAAGPVHRDFKPENVLIGDDGRARVTDFGLARVAGGPGPAGGGAWPSPTGAATQTGALLGTPAYMAPELFRGEPADAKSDQFSFCVALYEALFGARPFGTAADWDGALGPRGSAPPRGGAPAAARRVIARGLSVRPERRFASMGELLDELEGVRGERRARRLGLAAALALAALGAGGLAARARWPVARPVCAGSAERLAGAWDDARRAELRAAFAKGAAPHAGATGAAVERLLDRYARDWAAMRAEACEATHVRGEQSGELLDLRMACLAQRREALRALASLLAGDDEAPRARAVEAAAALPPLDECASRAALTSQLPPPADPAARAKVQVARDELTTARAESAAGLFAPGLARAKAAADVGVALGYRPLEAEAFLAVGVAHHHLEDAAAAEAALLRALRAAQASGHLAPAARAALSLAYVQGFLLRKHAQGYVWLDLAAATLERMGGAPQIESERLDMLGALLRDEGRANDAVPVFERALAVQEAALGPDHPRVAATLSNLAMAQADRERLPEAIELGRRSIEVAERLLGPDHPDLSSHLHAMAFILYQAGRAPEGRPFIERALAIESRAFGPDHPALVTLLIDLSNLCDDPRDAIASLERAWALQERARGPSHPNSPLILANLAIAHGLLGRHDEQLAFAERALPLAEAVVGPEHPTLVEILLEIGQARAALGRPAEALPALERALAVADRRPLTDSYAAGRVIRMTVCWRLAETLSRLGRDRTRARALMLRALELARGGGPQADAARPAIEAWLAGRRP